MYAKCYFKKSPPILNVLGKANLYKRTFDSSRNNHTILNNFQVISSLLKYNLFLYIEVEV